MPVVGGWHWPLWWCVHRVDRLLGARRQAPRAALLPNAVAGSRPSVCTGQCRNAHQNSRVRVIAVSSHPQALSPPPIYADAVVTVFGAAPDPRPLRRFSANGGSLLSCPLRPDTVFSVALPVARPAPCSQVTTLGCAGRRCVAHWRRRGPPSSPPHWRSAPEGHEARRAGLHLNAPVRRSLASASRQRHSFATWCQAPAPWWW